MSQAASSALVGIWRAADGLGLHPHDHGWRELYRLFAFGIASGAPLLCEAAVAGRHSRPAGSDTHLVTMLGIAVRRYVPELFAGELAVAPLPVRLDVLERGLHRRGDEVGQILRGRQNSFTGVRRFLVPQVIFGAYFADRPAPVRFADLGTGLGIMPRQLNCRQLFDRFVGDLAWPDGRPRYRGIPLATRHAVDRGPFPDLDWVRHCYGPSGYYSDLYRELVIAAQTPEVRRCLVRYHELDLTDRGELARFLRRHRINVVNLCYTLYEMTPGTRREVLETVAENLAPPALILVIEPRGELAEPGCTVTMYDQNGGAVPLCTVADGHFTGQVEPLAGYSEFVARHPISAAC